MYDFDMDGLINEEDVKVILKYAPLRKIMSLADLQRSDDEEDEDEEIDFGSDIKIKSDEIGMQKLNLKSYNVKKNVKINDTEKEAREEANKEVDQLVAFMFKDTIKLDLRTFTSKTET